MGLKKVLKKINKKINETAVNYNKDKQGANFAYADCADIIQREIANKEKKKEKRYIIGVAFEDSKKENNKIICNVLLNGSHSLAGICKMQVNKNIYCNENVYMKDIKI